MGIITEALEKLDDVGVDVGVVADVVGPLLELRRGRQFAGDEQVRDLEEARVLGDLLDRVAAVLEDALVAVDEGDGAPAAAVFMKAGSYVIRPKSSSEVLIWRRSIARIVPSATGIS
jgi:hypothetical protein